MKKMRILGLSLCLLAGISACKKDSADTVCEISVTSIAATYKLTKIESITVGVTLDITSTFLDPCAASGLYKLNADKSLIYTETSTCAGDGSGTWDLVSGNISLSQNGAGLELLSAPVTSFNCTNLVITTTAVAGASLRYTFTKQ